MLWGIRVAPQAQGRTTGICGLSPRTRGCVDPLRPSSAAKVAQPRGRHVGVCRSYHLTPDVPVSTLSAPTRTPDRRHTAVVTFRLTASLRCTPTTALPWSAARLGTGQDPRSSAESQPSRGLCRAGFAPNASPVQAAVPRLWRGGHLSQTRHLTSTFCAIGITPV